MPNDARAVEGRRRSRRMDRHDDALGPATGRRLLHLLFKHEGWREPVEFMHHCSTKWAIFLMSLKSLVETGKGARFRTT